jgi:hypothetical protein
VGRSSEFSYSASRYSYSYSKTPESIQVDHLFREAGTQVFGPLVNEILILLFEYEYRFTEYEYEYEKNHWYELPATIIPDRPKFCQGCKLKVIYNHRTRGDGAEGIHVRETIEAFTQQGCKVTLVFPSASRRELGISLGLTPFKESNQLAAPVRTRSHGIDREGFF